MAKYNIDFENLKDQSVSLRSIGKTLSGYENKLRSIAGSMDTRDSNMVSVWKKLNTSNNKIPGIQTKVSSSGRAAEKIAAAYRTAEKSNYYNIENVNLFSRQ